MSNFGVKARLRGGKAKIIRISIKCRLEKAEVTLFNKKVKQAGAELCQAQEKLGLAKTTLLSNKLMRSSIYLKIDVAFYLP